MQTRSEAIRNALTRYNTEAAKLSPPRPKLSWKAIVEYSFLAEFDLLRECRVDIRTQVWTDPPCREATIKYLHLQRAKEEIERLNVEIRRLHTSICDERIFMEETIDRLARSDHPLTPELHKRWLSRSLVNTIHMSRLNRIFELPYFTGIRSAGVRCGGAPRCEESDIQTVADSIQELDVDEPEATVQMEEAVDVLCVIAD
jgi:hypothetical protein